MAARPIGILPLACIKPRLHHEGSHLTAKRPPFASGLRDPGGIGLDEHGALFYVESQGPWNCSCSLKAVSQNSFHGHPAQFRIGISTLRTGARTRDA